MTTRTSIWTISLLCKPECETCVASFFQQIYCISKHCFQAAAVTGRCLALTRFEATINSPHSLYKKGSCVCYLQRSRQHTARRFQISHLRSRIIATPIKRTEQQFMVRLLSLVLAQPLLLLIYCPWGHSISYVHIQSLLGTQLQSLSSGNPINEIIVVR